MSSHAPTFRLKVQQVEQTCLFELSWGRGQQLTASLPYPPGLTVLFQEWQRVYLTFYKTASLTLTPILRPDSPLRGRAAESGSLTSVVDWHARVVEAEAKLLYEFHRWLRSGELYEIRARIAQTSRTTAEQHQAVNLFLTCTPLDLARLPWEAWEIGTEFAATGMIRIVRTPANIRAETVTPRRRNRSKARILAIMGDDSGLNFQTDRDAVRSLSRLADVRFVGWQAGQSSVELKTQIGQAIADPEGWDILFFAGHSNETQITGGELAIAPNVSMTICEIAPYLTRAKEQGLQFAIFNSCSGLNIAESLIDLGLSQVAVMREPIHNRVAQEFLVRFLQNLAEYKDVQESLLAACQVLKLEKNLTYPSAYLIPSLFCHPDATLFQIQPVGWRQRIQPFLPNRLEAIALVGVSVLSLLNPVQDWLLNQRVYAQSMYRAATGQVPPVAPPPVLLVQIDDKSIRLSGISNPNPIDRTYLAALVDRLAALDAQVVGVDYVLDRQQPGNDQVLAESVRSAVNQQMWFVFGATRDSNGQPVSVGEGTGIADLTWSMQGFIHGIPTYVRLPRTHSECDSLCPFAYLLSLTTTVNQVSPDPPQPALASTTDLQRQLLESVDRLSVTDPQVAHLRQLHLSPIRRWSGQFKQLWLHPIIDFSIPPDRAYDRIPAWQLLGQEGATPPLPHLSRQVVIIAAGGYDESGIKSDQADYFPLPAAMGFWRDRLHSSSTGDFPTSFTGAEAHAYMIHHLLSNRLVVPVPDLWMVLLAAIAGKGAVLGLRSSSQQKRFRSAQWVVITLPIWYGFIGLQLYLSVAVLLPWLLPSSLFWVYVLLSLRKNHYASP
ncbi:CHASE2 domain-containing protein [Oscillatoria sp. FACHB-1407]|uniref:CHASE2 domain-containing protein n=1 Tax=Oscillatoria sp. FACHB-1407 TaxID=2692847 RepID=UPI0016826039|nr:CHASE2 domain-containing protein [Oscillatoria sp. FACHB-1407]MBD2464380.1 CHASE2 domain-containing protein [Oscillatoria sp. FACHB-1407]